MLPEIHSGVSRYRTERRDDREPQICRLRSFLRENLGPGGAGAKLAHLVGGLWSLEQGQDIAEYAVMLAVILVLVVGDDSLNRRERKQRVFGRRQLNSMTPPRPADPG